jgi:hypothetical protein
MLRRTFADTGYNNQLVYDDSNSTSRSIYWVGFAPSGYVTTYSPALPNEIFYLYGINSGGDVGMPFNRVDYFVARPSNTTQIPSTCAQDTTRVGILYRATVNHDSSRGGKLTYSPILDCVADMQVVLGWNLTDGSGAVLIDTANPSANNATPGSGQIDTWSNADGSVASGSATAAQVQAAMTDPGHVRTKLKLVKVYILAQNGRKDPSYTSPSPITIGDPGEASLTRASGYTLTPNMLNYRWKVYRLVIRPKNLISNQ